MMIDVDNLTKKSLAALLDSTYLKAFGGPEKIDELCREAAEFGFASVAVNGCEVARCAAMLKGTGVKVTAVAGFPLGQMSAEAKLFEVRDVIAQGAGEVDIVQNVRRLQAGARWTSSRTCAVCRLATRRTCSPNSPSSRRSATARA